MAPPPITHQKNQLKIKICYSNQHVCNGSTVSNNGRYSCIACWKALKGLEVCRKQVLRSINNSTIATLCVNRCWHWWWVHNLWGCWILMAPSGNLTSVKKEQKRMSVRVVNLEGLRMMIESAKTWKLGIYLSDMREDEYMLLTREVLWSGRFMVGVSEPVSIIYPWILPAQPE